MKAIQSFVAVLAMMDFVASFGNANEDHSRRRLRGLKKPPKPEDDLPTTDIAPDIPQADQPGHNIKGKVSKKPKVSAVPIETSATKMPKKAKVTSAPQGTVKTPKLKRSKAPKGKATKAKTPKGKVVPKAKAPKERSSQRHQRIPRTPRTLSLSLSLNLLLQLPLS